jgi:hypothetical protein
MQNSQSKAVEFMRTGKAVTANVINKILSIYNIHTTDEALKIMVNSPRLTFNELSNHLCRDPAFIENLGKVKGKAVAGVYMFTLFFFITESTI